MLTNPDGRGNQHASLIHQFTELSTRDWRISVQHVYHEANFAADWATHWTLECIFSILQMFLFSTG
ncbi:hypothetical protein LINPERPRIM_LOCUS21433 [Linum perenne]